MFLCYKNSLKSPLSGRIWRSVQGIVPPLDPGSGGGCAVPFLNLPRANASALDATGAARYDQGAFVLAWTHDQPFAGWMRAKGFGPWMTTRDRPGATKAAALDAAFDERGGAWPGPRNRMARSVARRHGFG